MIIKEYTTKIKTTEPIVDLEIKNDLSPDWIYSKCDIITLGLLIQDKAIIIQREEKDDLDEFKNKIKELLKDIPHFYSFNLFMEKEGLKGFLGEDYNVKELKIWSGKGWNKDHFFEEIKKIVKVEDEIHCPFDGDGSKVQQAYSDGQYEDIMAHNLTCLIKEAYIKKYGLKLLEKYKNQINKDGWIEEEKVKKTFDKTNWDKEPATERQIIFLLNNGFNYEKDKLHGMNKLEASDIISKCKNVKNDSK